MSGASVLDSSGAPHADTHLSEFSIIVSFFLGTLLRF